MLRLIEKTTLAVRQVRAPLLMRTQRFAGHLAFHGTRPHSAGRWCFSIRTPPPTLRIASWSFRRAPSRAQVARSAAILRRARCLWCPRPRDASRGLPTGCPLGHCALLQAAGWCGPAEGRPADARSAVSWWGGLVAHRPRRPRRRLAAPLATATGTAVDATPAAEPPPVAATAVNTVAPSAAATVAAVAAAAEPVGGAWEGGRARREGRGQGGSRGRLGQLVP